MPGGRRGLRAELGEARAHAVVLDLDDRPHRLTSPTNPQAGHGGDDDGGKAAERWRENTVMAVPFQARRYG